MKASSIGIAAIVAVLIGAACGVTSALFLWLLTWATAQREMHPILIWFLPVAGVGIGLVYARYGQSIRGGTGILIERALHDGPQVPKRMVSMVLGGTILTHLFGGSAGREGTAVQMGGSLSDLFAHAVPGARAVRPALIAAGMAGGFASVFGTPYAGAVFALEILGRKAWSVVNLMAAILAAFAGHYVARWIGVQHTAYPSLELRSLTPWMAGKWVLFAVAAAIVTVAFIELTHGVKWVAEKATKHLPVRMFMGGLAVVGLWQLVGTNDYLGLGVPGILHAFERTPQPMATFAWKALFTAITVGTGFLGGEVTPLFFIGAAFGHAAAEPLGLPVPLAAGVGMAAIFAAAANSPLALSIMAVEIMGAGSLPHVVIVCFVAYWLIGRRGIYHGKTSGDVDPAALEVLDGDRGS